MHAERIDFSLTISYKQLKFHHFALVVTEALSASYKSPQRDAL
jgi:hypothetical protein